MKTFWVASTFLLLTVTVSANFLDFEQYSKLLTVKEFKRERGAPHLHTTPSTHILSGIFYFIFILIS